MRVRGELAAIGTRRLGRLAVLGDAGRDGLGRELGAVPFPAAVLTAGGEHRLAVALALGDTRIGTVVRAGGGGRRDEPEGESCDEQ